MRKKVIGILICVMLLTTSVLTTLFIPEKTHVIANPEEESKEGLGLDMEYIWTELGILSNVTYDAYDPTDIPKGRSFGSKGGMYTVDEILFKQMNTTSMLKNITTEQLKTVDTKHNNYSSIINVSDFSFTVNSVYGQPYPYENPIPKKEIFPIAVKTIRTNLWTHTYNFSDIEIKPMNLTKILPVWGDFESTIQILVFEFLNNNYLPLLGNVSYISENGSIPSLEEQFLQVFLLDDVNGVQEKLDNITNAAGVIIIDSGNPRIANASNCSYPVVLIYSNDGDNVKNLLENYIVFVDNVRSLSRKLTFTYDPNCYEREPYFVIDRIPDYNEFLNLTKIENVFNNLFYCIILNSYKIPVLKHLIAKLYPGFQTYLTCLQLKLYGLWFHPQCRGVILYDSDDYHFMWSMNTQSRTSSSVWFVKPTICVNNSVGKFLRDNCENKTLTGYITQEYLEEKQNAPGAIGENIYGNITIDKSPGNAIAIISNRYDGMFGATSGDSAVGTSIVLGLAKFFQDHPSVKPKYNLTFLFTTAEEYGFHGARYHCDNHSEQNIKYWLIHDQLGFNQEDCKLCLEYNDTHNPIPNFDKILDEIIKDSGYPEDKIIKNTGTNLSSGSEQGTVDQSDLNCTSLHLGKDQDRRWDHWHRTGNNYTEGDSMKNIDRDDVNATARLSLGLVKYFMINPDCWFTGLVTYTTVDSPNDSDVINDSINATFTVKTSLPVDKVRVRAMMKTEYNITRFWKDFDFNATSEGMQKTITVTLPPTFLLPAKYHLYLQLYNSTERINETVVEGSGRCNDTDLQTTNLTKIIYPRGNTNANKPNDIQGPDTLQVLETGDFNSSATDPNNDQLQFHWDWGIDTDRVGPYASGTPCSKNHTYILRGWKAIQVKVREDYKGQLYDGGLSDLYRYGSWSPWSDLFYIYIDPLIDFDMSCTAAASAQSATQSTTLPSIQEIDSIYEGFIFGGAAPYNYAWYFEDNLGPTPRNQTVAYNFSQTGIKSVTLNITDHDDYSEEITANITIINLSASYNSSLPSMYTSPGENITFDDTSAGISGRSIRNWTWDFGDDTVSYEQNPYHSYYCPSEYNVTLTVTDDEQEKATYMKTILIDYDDTPPVIHSAFSSQGGIGYGCNVSIVAYVSDHISGVKTVSVNITKPDNTTENLSMTHIFNDYYYSIFNDSTQPGVYKYGIYVVDYANNTDLVLEVGEFTLDFDDPQITNVSASPHTVGFGYNVTITANVTDWESGVDIVSVNITYPDDTQRNYTMSFTSGNTYQYVFTDTWLTGQYNYTIWAMDNSSIINNSGGHHFHVSVQATMSIATLKNSYSGTEYINITDPPNPPENCTLVDRGLTWDEYYNAITGQNILEVSAGPINYQNDTNTWTPINNTLTQLTSDHPAYVYGYRQGNDRGLFGLYFKSNAQLEWPVAFTCNKSDDPTIHAVRSKLVGVGYVDPQSNWAYQYLQNVQNSQGQINDYSITYHGVFTGTDVTWSYGNTGLKEEILLSNTTKTVLQSHPPSQYGLNDTSSYLVFITKLDYQNLNLYNGSGLLDGNVTISENGVEFRDLLGQFKCALPLGEAYELNNETARQKLTYRIIHMNGNTYLLSGLKIADLNAMTFPVVIDPTLTVYTSSNDGYIYTNNANYNTVRNATSGTVGSSATTLYLGQRKFGSTYFIYRGFLMFNTTALPSNAYIDNATISLYKNSDYSTTDFLLTVQNGQPTYPHNPLQTTDYNKDYYSGNGGSFNTSGFGSGYNNINLNTNGISWLNKSGWTKLCLRSNRDINGNAPTGNEFIIVYANEQGSGYQPKLVINYRNQSKIKNTGSTNIKGYLSIQIQFLDTRSGLWILDNDTINETTPRIITSGDQLALDIIFNGHVRASDLTHGTGTYRVYAAFRSPEGNILRTDDDLDLEAWWQFSKT